MKIGIIGFGPRGLACLENLVLELSKTPNTALARIYVFEPGSHLGTGKAWGIHQPEANYINISDHALQNLNGRETLVLGGIVIPSFPSYTQWCFENDTIENIAGDKDLYPRRSQMGRYLNTRATSMCDVLTKNNLLTIIKERVDEVQYKQKLIEISAGQTSYEVDECLLTMGHTPGKDSDETKEFKDHGKASNLNYIHNPYETEIASDDLSQTNVVIKGYGLSMLDITRQLTSYKYGDFKQKENSKYLQFKASKKCVRKIIPYSFDGLPCAPKPYGRAVDETFEPTTFQQNEFELEIRNHLAQSNTLEGIDFLVTAFCKVAAAIYVTQNDTKYTVATVQEISEAWLKDMSTTHELILDTTLAPVAYIKQIVEMAYGTIQPSLDYFLGQVWRHLQPVMYRLFAFSSVSGALMKQIIDLDQNTKRYSYGPPVESLLQLIALEEASILDLDYLIEPEVTLVNEGWKLEKGGASITAEMLVNSVMDGPALNTTDSTLLAQLKEQEWIQEVYEDLGILIHPDGTVIPKKKNAAHIPIAVVGRNAKGSILGADAILECFSPETQEWAKGVVSRIN